MHCSACEVDVADSAVRCSRCLRTSTLVAATQPERTIATKPKVSAGEVFVLLALAALVRVGAYVRQPLTSWLTVGDTSVTVLVAVATVWLARRARRESVAAIRLVRRVPLVTAGAIFGAFALAAGAGAVSLVLDPLAINDSVSLPCLHNWVWALLALLMMGALGWLSSQFFRKLARR